jgi:hypothetical protein
MKKSGAGTYKTMTRLFLILFAIVISSSVFGQQVNVSFKIVNNKNEVIPYASVTVTKREDKTLYTHKTKWQTAVGLSNCPC